MAAAEGRAYQLVCPTAGRLDPTGRPQALKHGDMLAMPMRFAAVGHMYCG
jgi:hypothetical protein